MRMQRYWILLILAVSGCSRSAFFKKEQEVYEDTTTGYYSRPTSEEDGSKAQVRRLAHPRKKVLVFSFWNDTPVQLEGVGEFAAEELQRELGLTKRVIANPDLKHPKSTFDFLDGDRVRVAQLVREGRKFGVTALVIGRIAKLTFRHRKEDVGLLRESQSNAQVELEVKIFDVAAGREVEAIEKTGDAMHQGMVAFENESSALFQDARREMASRAVRQAVLKFVPDILRSLDKMDWQGRIAKISGNRIFLNAGRQSGLVPGDILKVLSPGDEIYDPVTGAFLGRVEGQLKGTLEVSEFIGDDSTTSKIHTGANFQEGDLVRLY